MGSGRNTKHLSDEEWVRFNNYMRAHYNYVESGASRARSGRPRADPCRC